MDRQGGSRGRETDQEELIVNCLPLNEGERARFVQAAGCIRQRFVTDVSVRDHMQWPMGISQSDISDATIIFGNPSAEQISRCHRLRWLQTSSAGVDAYTAPGILPGNAILTSASGAYGQAVSEHMFAMMLALMKDLPFYRDRQAERDWHPGGEVYSPQESAVLVLGTGDIGAHFARLCKGAGAVTYGVRRHADQAVEGFDEIFPFDSLDGLLPKVDVVALALPSTPQTRHIIDADRLALMKKRAILLNVGRGDAVDCRSLASTLEKGGIFGAGLDVTEPEPLPPDHPLWSQPRCLITPHVAGGSHLASNVGKIIAICIDNLRRYRAGQDLRNRVR